MRLLALLAGILCAASVFALGEGIDRAGLNPFVRAIPSGRAFALRVEPVPVSPASPLQSLSQGER